jgi:hypothetical protein
MSILVLVFGTTDAFAFGIVENEVDVDDFHATCLHRLGIDPEKLTYPHQGRDSRLIDVLGCMMQLIIA